MPNATLLFTSLLTFLYLYLTLQVIQRRRLYRVALGAPEAHPELQHAVRAHGNLQEYVPLFLILLYLTETVTHLTWLCYLLGTLFLSGRLAHAYSLLVYEPRMTAQGQRARVTYRFRFFAMVQTFTCLIVLALILLFSYFVRMAG